MVHRRLHIQRKSQETSQSNREREMQGVPEQVGTEAEEMARRQEPQPDWRLVDIELKPNWSKKSFIESHERNTWIYIQENKNIK